MKAAKSLIRRPESGIALLTTLLLMMLMSSLLVGFILLITSGQKLSGINNDYSRAFYAAEAGMEKITADLGTLFDTNYSPSAAQINAIATTPPTLAGINYVQYDGASGYQINYNTDANGNPLATITQIQSGAYQGMSALATQYTLLVTARTQSNNEVKLQRTTQTVGIPMFQFGIFSDTDLSFFPGPNFNFGGRTHTNGNLFLAAGATLKLSDRVTAVKDVIRTNLSNGFPTTTGQYNGTVDITTSPGTTSYRALAYTEGSLVGTVGTAVNPNWTNISLGATNYAGNLRNGATGATALNLGIVLLGNGTTQSIDLIRRPFGLAESASVTNLRYFAQASLKILLSDNAADITSLPCTSGTAPVDLSQIATPPSGWVAAGGFPAALYAKMTANNTAGLNTPPVPLAASGAVKGATAYTPADGYWLPTPNAAQYTAGSGLPIIKGFLKIDLQTSYGNPCGTWQDVTLEVLGYGYAGRNLYPQGALIAGVPALPATLQPASTCPDVHPNAIIRLERVRDNPSNWTAANPCGSQQNLTPASQIAPGAYINGVGQPGVPADYWPNALFDTREGTLRDVQPAGQLGTTFYSQMVTLGGVMQYIELDAKNLAAYFAKTGAYATGSGHLAYDSVNAPNDYTVYISDRRGNYTANALTNPWPPLSPSQHETGEYGWDDFVNSGSNAGCPDQAQNTGEDLDGLGATGFYTYGQDPTYVMAQGTGYAALLPGQYGTYSLAGPGNLYGAAPANNAITANPNPGCNVTVPSKVWPMDYVIHANEARENPNPFFRRAVKIVDGNLLTALGACPGTVPCGLAIATENPAYIQGDFNANSAGGGFNDPNVAASLNADAVTLLSNGFNDVNTFAFPFLSPYNSATGNNIRNAVNPGVPGAANNAWYRVAVMAGKGFSFPQPFVTDPKDFGTDGGVHNFLRYIENWGANGGQTLNYLGSIISMYTNRQAVGTFKCCTTVYSPPTRGYNFDVEFLTPSLLPPRTPLFRDVNTTGFTQLLLPNQ
jgi:Tfp pilus assembly protein PilX